MIDYRSYYDDERPQLYSLVYEKNGVKSRNRKKSKSVTRRKKRNRLFSFQRFISILFCAIFLFAVLPYSFSHYISGVFDKNVKNPVLNIDYYNLLYPTHSYLYKNLFLGRYIMPDTKYKKVLMKDIPESNERIGLKSSLLRLAGEYHRIKPAVYVWEYEGKSFVNIDADAVYPAASIIKIPVLIEMLRQTDKSKFDMEDKMVLDDYYRAPGSGKLQYAGAGEYSIDYLAGIMIENSDNSATNMIMSKEGGMPELNRAMRMWGLKNTAVNNWLPDMEGTNVTTARETAKMLYNLDMTDIVSPESKKRAGYYLSHVKNNRLLQAGLPPGAILMHKTGDIGYMLGDAGIVKAENGKKYIVVILVKRPYNNLQGKEFIVRASKMIYDHITY